MKSYEWSAPKQTFVEVDDPIEYPGINDINEGLSRAGYAVEMTSGEDGAIVTVYMTENESKPRFYIDIMGQTQSIATLVARDFIALVETMKQIHPLLTVVGLDQFYTARVADQVEREYGQKK